METQRCPGCGEVTETPHPWRIDGKVVRYCIACNDDLKLRGVEATDGAKSVEPMENGEVKTMLRENEILYGGTDQTATPGPGEVVVRTLQLHLPTREFFYHWYLVMGGLKEAFQLIGYWNEDQTDRWHYAIDQVKLP